MLIILEINKANVNTKVDGRKQGAQAPVQIDTNARIWLLIIRNNVNWKAEILYLLRARKLVKPYAIPKICGARIHRPLHLHRFFEGCSQWQAPQIGQICTCNVHWIHNLVVRKMFFTCNGVELHRKSRLRQQRASRL